MCFDYCHFFVLLFTTSILVALFVFSLLVEIFQWFDIGYLATKKNAYIVTHVYIIIKVQNVSVHVILVVLVVFFCFFESNSHAGLILIRLKIMFKSSLIRVPPRNVLVQSIVQFQEVSGLIGCRIKPILITAPYQTYQKIKRWNSWANL